MKFTKTLASVCAAAIAVSSLAVSAFAGSITFSDKVWWTQKDLKIEDILEGNKPEDVESITFTGDTAFLIGYNSTKVTDEKTGSTWKQDATAADTYTVSDAVLAPQEIEGKTVNPAFSVMLSKGDGVDYTINWKVNLKNNDPAEPVAPADVTIANSGRTVIDSGLVRTNIINEWTGNDADVIADKAAFAGANKISVKFTVTNFTTPFKAWIAMADSKWECQFQGEGDERNANAKCTPVEVTGNGTYVVTIDLDKVIDGVAFISVCTDLKAADGDAIPTIAIDQIKINEEITVKPGESDPTKPGESDPTKPGESDPVKPGESDPVKPGESDPVKPGDCSGEPVNPPTGAAVAVIPAALAAAAVATTGIVLKKRSK